MPQLADRLTELAADGQAITFLAIGLSPDTVASEAGDVAAGPFAPYLAEAVADAYDRSDAQWQPAATAFPKGLASQPSVLHLSASMDALLHSPTAAKALGKPLTTALLNDLLEQIERAPLLAAARLEGAVRLAVADAVTPFKVWQALEDVPSDGPEDFLERLPRLLGLTLDRWSDEDTIADTVRNLLQQLTHDEAADVDAMFELGCDLLRRALTSQDLGAITSHLVLARKQFETAAQAEEARDDARTYAAVCDAILAFSRHDAETITRAADEIADALDQREAWLHRTYQASWLQPRRSAEIAWQRLILQLRAAATALQEDAWMDAWQALDTVLSAYSAARTVCPLAGDTSQGMVHLVQPAIEDRFLRQQAFLAQLRRAAQESDQHAVRGFDAATASALLQAVEAAAQREPEDAAPSPGGGGSDDDDPGGAAMTRLQRLAPTLLLLLGDRAISIGIALDDQQLLLLEGLAYDSDVSRLKATDPLIVPKLDELMTELSAHPTFTGEVRRTFSALVEQTLLFLKSRSDLTRSNLLGATKKDEPPPFDYRRKPEGKGARKAVEADLQRDFHQWLHAGPLHNVVLVEPVDVGMGRADVMAHFGALRYLTEIKQDGSDNDRMYLEGRYLAQAAEYSNTNAPFGQLLVLDLTPKSDTQGNMRVDEAAWTTLHRPKGTTTDRAVVVGIVAGNRVTPSAYSRK
ncbi:hypothetical protein OG819_56070 [Streptomyces sp. NBC_01549]|uniref:hypothetical protein n=1 Tax=Streptomyces sp. NBC_01549 TaxID=2975874 RepID=UPI002255B113|nr:hypothetical protein [Streptomyces sp. NBC_01549]MCX4598469.1 hypothetical protein [Streptomyces sp. NBC_01549]